MERKVALLRYSLGTERRAQYRAIQDEEAEGEDEFQKTIARLKRRFATEKGLAAARLEFVKRRQLPGESLIDFAGALRKLGNRCKFPMSLDDAIVTQLTVHTVSEAAREKLMSSEETEKFEDIVTKAAQAERNTKEAVEPGLGSDRRVEVAQIQPQ